MLTDSGAVELRNRLVDHFGVDLPVTLTFDQPSLLAIAEYLSAKLRRKLSGGPAVAAIDRGHVHENGTVTAVVGVSVRFPGSSTLEGFWMSAIHQADLQQTVPYDRWNIEEVYHPSIPPRGMTLYVRFGAFCEGDLAASKYNS